MAINPGCVLGGYKIAEPLGAGGMGEVYRATQSSLGRQVAVKILSAQFVADPERLRRFEQEARAASALNHPNIISIYDVGRDAGVAFIAMELVEGKTLRSLLDSGQLPVKRALAIAAQIADGLAKAHAAGIVHRDLKPENIMVTRDGFVKILDFGLAKLAAERDVLSDQTVSAVAAGTDPGTVLGTVGYMSPEQARGAKLDFRSDIFSFGAILYEMVAGKRPFHGASSAQTMSSIIEDEPKSIAELNPKAPAPLCWAIERCLAKEPDERYASTRDLARDLASLRDHLSESSISAIGVATPVRTRATRTAVKLAAAAAALVIGVAAGWFLPRPAQLPPEFHPLTFSGHDTDPTVSPDGRMVAFVSDRDGTDRIWLQQLGSGSETALSEGPDQYPRFSPDGQWLLFIRNESLYRMPALGGEPRKLLDNVNSAGWSPDGQQIAFLRRERIGPQISTLLGIASAQDGSSRIIHRFENETEVAPAWSPDGRTIAMVPQALGVVGASQRYVRLISSDGTNVRQVFSPWPGGAISAVTWCCNGSEIIYAQPQSTAAVGFVGGRLAGGTITSTSDVILENVNTGKARKLFATNAPPFRLEIAGKGRIILDSFTQRENIKEVPLAGAAPGSQERWLTRGYSIDRQPFYAPDGKSVVFSSSRGTNPDIWEVAVAGNAERRLTDNPASDWDPFVTRDGKHLLWSSDRRGNFEIWMADRDGSSPVQISHDGYDAENPTETPDGTWIVYASGNPEHPGLWRINSDGTNPTRLVAGTISWPDVSPGGEYALYHVVDPGGRSATIGIVRIRDGTKLPFELSGLRGRFAPGGRSIVCIRYSADVPLGEIVEQQFLGDTKAPVKVLVPASPDYAMQTLELSPDGKQAVISYNEAVHNLIVADGVEGVTPPPREK